MNQWQISGEVTYIKELQGEFGASLQVEGTSKRSENSISIQKIKLPCLMTNKTYKESIKKGLRKFASVQITGHMESWEKNGKPKIYFIADSLIVRMSEY